MICGRGPRNYWWTYLAEHLSEPTSFGYAQRVLIMAANHQPNNVGQQGAIPARSQLLRGHRHARQR
jgi:hypothetical protein